MSRLLAWATDFVRPYGHESSSAGSGAGTSMECGASKWLYFVPGSESSIFHQTLVTLLALVAVWIVYRRMSAQLRPFRFMDLPPELRDQVYNYLLEDPYFPPPPTNSKNASLPLNWIPGRRLVALQAEDARPRRSNWVLAANRQCYAEFMGMVCKRRTFHLTVSPANFPSPSETDSVPGGAEQIWKISPDVLKKVRKCDIKLITTPAMLGVSDPRNMTPSSWSLLHRVREQLRDVSAVEELNLHVKALGDPLWNPLWVWYHASQSFKTMGTTTPSSKEGEPLGPKLHRITFSLDTWSPGENYLARDGKTGQWHWHCLKSHAISADPMDGEMTVREFCRRLYEECRVCSPESDSEDDGDA